MTYIYAFPLRNSSHSNIPHKASWFSIHGHRGQPYLITAASSSLLGLLKWYPTCYNSSIIFAVLSKSHTISLNIMCVHLFLRRFLDLVLWLMCPITTYLYTWFVLCCSWHWLILALPLRLTSLALGWPYNYCNAASPKWMDKSIIWIHKNCSYDHNLKAQHLQDNFSSSVGVIYGKSQGIIYSKF